MTSEDKPDSGLGRDTGQVWAAMSHEIRTPLMGVVGMLEILSRTSLTDEQRRIIATAEESSVALMRIVDDVLDFAKLETAQARLEPVPTDLAGLLETSAELLANTAAAKGLALTSEADADLPTVLCDPLRLRQVLLNLGANAIKFTDRGHVAFTAQLLDRTPSHAVVRLTVSDSGVGIPQELHAFLFKPFSQLATTNSTGFGGVGLGLAICRNLVNAMGGSISVDSESARGSRFHVTVPFPLAQDVRTASTKRSLADVGVIAVDAGEPALQIAVRYLDAEGANVTLVRSLSAITSQHLAAQAGKRTVIVVGPEAEAEDIEAATSALKLLGGGAYAPVLWLHPPAVGGTFALARRGVRAIRAHPIRRAELLAAVVDARPVSEGDPAAYLTRSASALPALNDDDAVAAARAEGRVVLVAEDNPVNQEVVRQQLAILGYDCDIAASGSTALRALSENAYLLLLCDCHMPGMDGFELTRIIRAGERAGTTRLPIIAITANALPGEAARCKSAGMDDYLAKPIEIRTLESMLNRWIAEAKKSSASSAAISAIENASHVAPATGTVDLRNIAAVYGDDRKRLAPVLDQWLTVIEEATEELSIGLSLGKWDDAVAAVHRIKGSAGIAGAHDLSAAGAVLEGSLRSGDLERILEDGDRVRTLAQRALAEVVAWREKNVPPQAALSDKLASGITT